MLNEAWKLKDSPSRELEETGRMILNGEITMNEYIDQCKQKAMKLAANEI
jgi:hypothetical protein